MIPLKDTPLKILVFIHKNNGLYIKGISDKIDMSYSRVRYWTTGWCEKKGLLWEKKLITITPTGKHLEARIAKGVPIKKYIEQLGKTQQQEGDKK